MFSFTKTKTKGTKGKIKAKRNSNVMNKLSKIGKALLFPIAMLPFAAILLRIGAAIPNTTAFSGGVATFLLSAANVIFKNLAILFGVGLAFGLTKKRRGEAALIGFVGVTLVMAMMSRPPYSVKEGGKEIIIAGGFFSSGLDLSNLFYKEVKNFHDVFGKSYNDILANNVFTGLLVGLFVA
jgi:phosphotransferase system  glucose/maltose/N-acetylglucosamine-specific IIC component